MEEFNDEVNAVSSSLEDISVETALSFNLSRISSANSFDYDYEFHEDMGSKKSQRRRREKRNSQKATSNEELSTAVMKLEESLGSASFQLMADDDCEEVIDGLLLAPAEVSPVTRPSAIPVLSPSASFTRTARPSTEIHRISEALLPGNKPSRIPRYSPSKSTARSVSSASSDKLSYIPEYGEAAVADDIDAATPEATNLSSESEYGNDEDVINRSRVSSVTSSTSILSETFEVEPATVRVVLGHASGVQIELGINMSMDSGPDAGPLVLTNIDVPNFE